MSQCESIQQSEAVLIYNPKSGKQDCQRILQAGLGIPAIPFFTLLQQGTNVLSPDITKIIVAGGDGTVFSVARMLATQLPSNAVLDFLVLPMGTENVAASLSNVVPDTNKPEVIQAVVTQFLQGRLDKMPLHPFQVVTPDTKKDLGFWSVGVGGIAPLILYELERRRSVKDPTLRKTLATLAMLLHPNKRKHRAETNNGALLEGLDVAYISSIFHYWPKFLNVAETCASSCSAITQPHDYLLRFGNPEQSTWQTYCGLLLDFAALRLMQRPVTGTLYVEPVVDPIIEMTATSRVFAVDSEIFRSKVSGPIKINRQPTRPLPQIHLAYQPRNSTR